MSVRNETSPSATGQTGPDDNAASVEAEVDALIRGPQYSLPQAEKEARLLGVLRERCRAMAVGCPAYGRFLSRCGAPLETWQSLRDIPPLPVSMFKHFRLSAIEPAKELRELRSSSTTGQQPSRIVIDKTTSFRQNRALAAILREHIGPQRRPYLVIDAAETVAAGENLTARGTAIRGIGSFASETVFALRTLPTGDLEPDWPAIEGFFAAHAAGPVLLFGFTFMVWTRFVQLAEAAGKRFHAPEACLLHSGGWKKLEAQAVSKDDFARRTAALLGNDPRRIFDFYGMVEQVGSVYVDCEAGHKHAPAFADVLIRRPLSLAPVAVGETGIIEVLSALPTSYPGQALITEDQGTLLGVDDCPCGRRGSYFRFTKRIERVEIRGCGDTFAQTRELR